MIFLNKIKNKILSSLNILKQKNLLRKIKFNDNIILIFVPDADVVNGGVMSLVNLRNEFKNLKYIHNSDVFLINIAYNPSLTFNHFSKFKNDSQIFNLQLFLDKIVNCSNISFHIPECLISKFNYEFNHVWTNNHKQLFYNYKIKSVNILNQNHLLMPNISEINDLKGLFNSNISMTFAHKKSIKFYKNEDYDFPMHYMSAWINSIPYERNGYFFKKNFILISPDSIDRSKSISHISKEEIIDKLKSELPHYQVIVINNLSYEEYKNLVFQSKFVLTFGEGLDGYFIENILMGGVSFAVFNSIFFTKDYQSLMSVYDSFEELFQNIVNDMKSLDNFDSYDKVHRELYKIVELEYTFDKFQNRVKNYFLKKYSV
jgi:hypothetical protein